MKHLSTRFLNYYQGISLIFVALSISSISPAQIHRPFDPNSVALYTTSPVPGPTSSLAFTNMELQESDSLFHMFKSVDIEDNEAMIEPTEFCDDIGFWASAGMCILQDLPKWFGRVIRKTGPSIYVYETTFGDTLVFNFGTAEGDTSLIYQSSEESLLLISEGSGTYSHLDIEDSVNEYRLAHLDSQGQPLGTDLHDAPITLGNQLGSIHFMRIDSFPQVAQPIILAGHTGAMAGLYEIKDADVYDYSVNDVYQYRYKEVPDPFTSISYYETFTVSERTEDENEIHYVFEVHRFTPDSTTNTFTEEELTVSKTNVLASFPFESENSIHPNIGFSGKYKIQDLTFTPDECMSEYTYSITASHFMTCPQDGVNCYGNTLHVAPGESYSVPSERIFKQGLGRTYRYSGWSIMAGPSFYTRRSLIYYQKDGVECGDQVVLNITNRGEANLIRSVYPNPAKDILNIALKLPLINKRISLQVFDALGREVDIRNLTKQMPESITLNTTGWNEGIYLFRILDENNPIGEGKFLVVR